MKDFSFPVAKHINNDGHNINDISICIDSRYGSNEEKELIKKKKELIYTHLEPEGINVMFWQQLLHYKPFQISPAFSS